MSLAPVEPLPSRLVAAMETLTERYGPEKAAAMIATFAREHDDAEDFALIEQRAGDVTGEGWRTDPATMAAHLDPTFRRPRHVRYLSRKFRQLVTGESKRQVWNLPGRYGKSFLAQWGVTWAFDRNPGARFIYTCYGDDLADENADGIREHLRAHAGQLRCQLRKDRQRLDRFVTDAGGGLLAAGMNSAIVGFGCGNGGGLIIDDPFKNWQEAHSEARREHIYNQFRGTLANRLDDESAWILVIHHRVHEDDLTARLVREMLAGDEYADQWDVTSLPALAAENDPLGREPGEPLDPEKFPLHVVRNRIARMGSYLASGLELQNPTPEEGNDIKRAWWQISENMPVAFDDALVSWDTKMKDKESGDFVVGQVWARAGAAFWCIAEFRGQWNQATMRAAMALAYVRYPFAIRQVVEYTGYGPEVVEQLQAGSGEGYEIDEQARTDLGITDEELDRVLPLLRFGMPGIQHSSPKGDKRVRARAVTPLIEGRNCFLPEHAPFIVGFLDEVSAFPNGQYDDRVDAMSQALSKLWGQDAEFADVSVLTETRIPGVGRPQPGGLEQVGSAAAALANTRF